MVVRTLTQCTHDKLVGSMKKRWQTPFFKLRLVGLVEFQATLEVTGQVLLLRTDQVQGLSEMADRLVRLSSFCQQMTIVNVSRGVIRIDSQRRSVMLDCVLGFPEFYQRVSPVVVTRSVSGVDLSTWVA